MPWEEPQGSAGDIDNALARIRRWRKIRLWADFTIPVIGAIFFGVFAATASLIAQWPWIFKVEMIAMVIAIAVLWYIPSTVLYYTPCPRCGLRFHRVSFFLKRFNRACRHCHLPINGQCKDEARTYWRDP